MTNKRELLNLGEASTSLFPRVIGPTMAPTNLCPRSLFVLL